MGHPFPFFGAAPDEFESGFAPYVVTFERELSDAERTTVVAGITSAMRAAGVALGDTPKWEEASVLVVFDERVPDWDQFFEDVGAAFGAAHQTDAIAHLLRP